MDIIDWNRIKKAQKSNLRDLKIVFVAGSICVSMERVKEIVSSVPGDRLVFGVLKDEWIPGLEGSLHFKPMQLLEIEAMKSSIQLFVLHYFYKDLKYIIKALNPQKILFVNGSWSGQLHYQEFYWTALKRGIDIELVSPFIDETEASNYEESICGSYKKLYQKNKKYSDDEIFGIIETQRQRSWDWIGQTACALVQKQKILALAHNRVMPYQAYQLHEGSIREQLQTPAQEMIETQLTNHAEVELVLECLRSGIDMSNSSLYINMFPCPVCAKMLARTEISEILYRQDHNLGNDIGYRILEKSGKSLRRMVM